MQQKFALRKTLKKVAAVGASLALVGVTVSGALAAGLGDLPSPFNNNAAQTVVVYGSSGADLDAANDVVSAVGGSVGSSTVIGGTSTATLNVADFETGERDDLDVGRPLTAIWGTLDESDAVGLTTFKIGVDTATLDKTYDAHEIITFVTAGMNLTTALEAQDEDYADKVFVKANDKTMTYEVEFEENLDANANLTHATSDRTISVPFLGKQLVISGATATSITAYAGDETTLRRGDTVQTSGKTIKLLNVDSDSIQVDVDGVTAVVSEGSRKRVNDIEIYVVQAFNSDDDANDSAQVVVQGSAGQAVESYNDGEEFPDEDESEYLWEWQLASLADTTSTTIDLAVTNNQDFDDPDATFPEKIFNLGLLKENVGYIPEGGYLCLPYRYACLVVEGPVGDYTYADYSFTADQKLDLDLDYANSGTFVPSINNTFVVEIKASGVGSNRGLQTVSKAGADLKKTDTVWLHVSTNETGQRVGVYYKNSDNSNPTRSDWNAGTADDQDYLADIALDALTPNLQVARFDNGDYNAGIFVNLYNSSTANKTKLVIDGAGTYAGNFTLELGSAFTTITNTSIGFFGSVKGDAGAGELNYTSLPTVNGHTLDISGFNNDMKSPDGLVIKDPEGNLDNDKVVVSAPNDNEFKYYVRVAKPLSGSTTTSGTTPGVASLRMKDTEVGNVATLGKNVVAVGGPAVNQVTASLLGLTFPTFGSSVPGLQEGKAVLEMKPVGSKQALLVYGWDAADTRRAAFVVKNAASFKTQLGSKQSATVTGTGTDLTVSGITVA
jgi:hypothetical protein